MVFRFTVVALGIILSVHAVQAASACRKVTLDDPVSIEAQALNNQLHKLRLDKRGVLSAIRETSIPEADGCWGMAAGNFDGALLSVGVAQWNLGSGTLQPLLVAFRAKYSEAEFANVLADVMPNYGAKLFSDLCTRVDRNKKVKKECADYVMSLQSKGAKLNPDFKEELRRLFETQVMIQIQTDAFVRLLTSVADDIARLFPATQPSALQIKWAIDTKVQQNSFPGDIDVTRVRRQFMLSAAPIQAAIATTQDPGTLSDAQIRSLSKVIDWYRSYCDSIDQEGIRLDCKCNASVWGKLVTQLDAERADLLLLSHLRSRISSTDSGRYQANTFQRRAKIIFGVGSLGGRKDGKPDLLSPEDCGRVVN